MVGGLGMIVSTLSPIGVCNALTAPPSTPDYCTSPLLFMSACFPTMLHALDGSILPATPTPKHPSTVQTTAQNR